jgi:hypothetical protein
MTAAEWLGSTDIAGMLAVPAVASRDRKVRLFGVACCRLLAPWLESPRIPKALEAAERYADGALGDGAFRRWSREVCGLRDSLFRVAGAERASTAYHIVYMAMQTDRRSAWRTVAADILRHVRDRGELGPEAAADLPAQLPRLLRCIFGNPFRPVTFDPAWRTSTVLQLAAGIYEERAPDRLPILADALQDAGCDSDDILDHCRGEGPHVRGCWVVDLVLGKE